MTSAISSRAGRGGPDLPGAGAAVEDRAGLRAGHAEQAGGRRAADHAGHGDPVAAPVHRPPAGRACRRAAPGPPAVDPAGPGRRRRGRDAGGNPEGRHALVTGLDGPPQRPVTLDDRPDLAQVRTQAAPDRRVQAVHRPAVHREGRRRRRSLPQPAGEGRRAVRRREIRHAGPGPVPAGAADDARHARTAHPRLRPERRDQPVRRLQHRRRHRDLPDPPPAPRGGVQEVPDRDRQGRPGRAGRAPGLRQPRHPQDPRDPGLARPPPPVPPALHAHRIVVDQPGGAVVRVPDRPNDPPRSPQERPGPGKRRPRLDRNLEPEPPAIHLDKNRGGDPELLSEYIAKISGAGH